MKILIIDKEAKFRNGVVVYNQRLIDFLREKGHEVHILRWSNSKETEPHITHIPYYFENEKFYLVILPTLKGLKKIRNTIKQVKPDIVYTTVGLSTFDSLISYITHREKTPIGGILHMDASSDKNLYQYLIKIAWVLMYLPYMKHLDFLNLFSGRIKNFFVKMGVAEQEIEVIPNGIDSSLYTPGVSEFAKKHNFKKGVLFLGRLSWQKNPEFLLKSFLKINPDNDTKLIIVGGGELYEKLSQKYKDERIIFTGFIDSDKERIDIIRSCQIFSLASRGEGLSLSQLEAMSCGLMPIVSDVGSSKDVTGDTGVSIKINNLEEDFPKELKKYLDDIDLSKKMGEKARQRIEEFYSLEKNFNKLITALEKHIAYYKEKHKIN
ncbi:MAG TPA: glycosyltransferase family 4 protein [Candidatus Sulfotelmatobacter sp.]|nr:glycosyltransferase family 4 protein [Candidatus Sulfotelmatobacter sp.]